MNPKPRPLHRVGPCLSALLFVASRGAFALPAAGEPPAPPALARAAASGTAELRPEGDLPEVQAVEEPDRPSLRELCHVDTPKDGPRILATSRQRLQETFCGANLWFDGLFGGEPDVQNARSINGRVELSSLYTEAEGVDVNPRLRLDYDLPTLERRLKLFIGREDRNEFVRDRHEGVAIHSSIFDLEEQDRWLAGLGYSLPGSWASRVDFRIGAKLRTSPEVFAQARYRHNWFVGERVVVRARETLFWQNREQGFGATTSVDVDRVLSDATLLRLNGLATISQDTEGTWWRTAALLYHNLPGNSAMAYETFVRGETGWIPITEYGGRVIYRRALGYQWLFGEVIAGYTWPKLEPDERRQRSAMVGFGFELYFGRQKR